MSDVHSPICLEINIPQDKATSPTFSDQNFEKIPFKSSWKPELKLQYKNGFSEAEISLLSEKVTNAQLSSAPSKMQVEEIVLDLTSIILKPAKSLGMCKKVAKKSNKGRKCPKQSWFDKKCEEKRKIFFKAKNAIRKAKTDEEKKLCQENLDQKSKEYKKFIASHQKLFNKQLHKQLRELHRHNPREYWNLLKNAKGTQKNDPQIPLSEFETFFRNLNQGSSTPTENSDFDSGEIDPSIIEEFNLDFTNEEILKNIHNLKNNKSEGGDYIKNEFLKNLPLSLVELIVKLFNLILRTGHVPEEWAIGLIVPIFKKKGSKSDPNNYRGITLLSCLGKLFTLCLNNRISIFSTNRGIIGEEQAAFREDYSTLDHAFVLNELINMYLQNGKKKRLYCCFIDYQKAFDTIRRSALWGKMIKNGINGKILRVIFNMYETAKSCVKQQSIKSGLFSCNMGVRQGENLSPLLFSFFLNDFETALRTSYNGLTNFRDWSRILGTDSVEFFINMYVLLYADDTLVMAESPQELQSALNEVSQYCNKWGLTINQTKTKVVIFSKGKVRKQFNFKIGDLAIGTASEYCYLGILFNYNGKLTNALKNRITPARKAMFSLNENVVKLLLPPDIHLDLFEKMITPILLYGSEIWGSATLEPLEIFYRNFIKRMLGLGRSTPNCIVYGEVGRKPLQNQIYNRMISFWVKISEGKTSKLSSLMYNLIYKLHLNESYHSPWLLCIKKILCDTGNPYFWYNQEMLMPKDFIKNIVSTQLNNQFLQQWNFEMNRNRRCIIYKTFKNNLIFEPYLKDLHFLERRALSRFRCGSHNLPISKNRLTGGNEEETKCKFCECDYCDEFHVLFCCEYFKKQRKTFLKNTYLKKPSAFKMIELFNSNKTETCNLAKFCQHIISRFDPSFTPGVNRRAGAF
jgi:hypothetical protein